VGRLVPEKGLRELMTALSDLPEVRGALVGEGGLRHEIEARAEALGGRISLPGDRPLDEVATWLAAADVLVLPSWAEGTPNVVLEALAAGRPVVATSVGGIPDVVEHGRTGLLVPPGDAAALRAALDEALSRRWDPAALAAAAPPTWDESAGHLHELLREVAAARTPGGVAPGTTRVAA
jgi:teichuronic acid biosynthesis glycosyltransferase TuaC